MMAAQLRLALLHQRPCFVQAVRGTAAVLAALVVATLLQLENPFWAAMTALIVIQPTRGLLLEKSFYRLVGTVAGSASGLLLILATRSPLMLTVALTLWVSCCVGIGNLLYGLRSYAFMMAACTCSVIAMSGYLSPPHIYSIAFGRIACIIVGIIVTTGVTALFTPRRSGDELTDRLGRVAGETVEWLALLLYKGQKSMLARRGQDILIEIAEIEGLLDDATAGSFRFKQQKRQQRNLLAALLSLLAVGRLVKEQLNRQNMPDRGQEQWRELLARHLDVVAGKLTNLSPVNCLDELAAVVARVQLHLPLLGETLTDLVNSLHLVLVDCGAMAVATKAPARPRLIRHRDWQEARRAAIRAALAIAAVGGIWAFTGWSKGPLMLIALSIMISIFSSKEHPAGFVGKIFIGAAIGSAAAVFCRIVLLSGVSDSFMTSAIISPFILLGLFAMQQRRLAISATDATLFFLFVSQAGVSVDLLFADMAIGAAAMVMGVGSAWLAYRYLVPINPAIRLRSLMAAIVRDLERLAVVESTVALGTLTARLQHRVMRLVALATRNDADHRAIVRGGIAALTIAGSARKLREMLVGGDLPLAAFETVREALRSLGELGQSWENAPMVLEHLAASLHGALYPEQGAPTSGRGHEQLEEPDDSATACWQKRRLQCHT